MTAAPVPVGHLPVSPGQKDAHSLLARWAVGLAGAVVAAVSVSAAIFAAAYAIGGWSATEDNWVAFVAVASLGGGMLVSLSALALAVIAKVKHERWALLWLPLTVFPALLAFVVLGEAFWWE